MAAGMALALGLALPGPGLPGMASVGMRISSATPIFGETSLAGDRAAGKASIDRRRRRNTFVPSNHTSALRLIVASSKT